jgi:hypothetical protein
MNIELGNPMDRLNNQYRQMTYDRLNNGLKNQLHCILLRILIRDRTNFQLFTQLKSFIDHQLYEDLNHEH